MTAKKILREGNWSFCSTVSKVQMPKFEDPSLSITVEALPTSLGEWFAEKEICLFPTHPYFYKLHFSADEVKNKMERMKNCKDVVTVSVSEIEDDDGTDLRWDPPSSPVWDKSKRRGNLSKKPL